MKPLVLAVADRRPLRLIHLDKTLNDKIRMQMFAGNDSDQLQVFHNQLFAGQPRHRDHGACRQLQRPEQRKASLN
jgi:hypothetical protein